MVTNSRVRIDGAAVDVKIVFRQNLGAFVNGTSRAVEDSAQHVLRDANFHIVARELDFGLSKISHLPSPSLVMELPS